MKQTPLEISHGQAGPLGAHWDGTGINFAVFSANAKLIELCLFDQKDEICERYRLPLRWRTGDIWHCYIKGLSPGQIYGYRVDGVYKPENGKRFNHHKVLLDPYARAIARLPQWHEALFGYERLGVEDDHLFPDVRDSANCAALAMVIEDLTPIDEATLPQTPLAQSVFYEAHVKGLTKLYEKVPAKLRGTYLGLASKPIIEHLHGLGVTAIELLPVHQGVDDWHLVQQGLSNYWGYNPLAYFVPSWKYATKPDSRTAISEFRQMVEILHAENIEVIVDVVYNHTCEGNHCGQTLSFRGIDNESYYRLENSQPQYYTNYTGCGNTVNADNHAVQQLILESLRYWASTLGVDGFRFDLATVLGRGEYGFSEQHPVLRAIAEDPVLSRRKLIAEPWDLGEGGYQLGNFPQSWSEWNDKFRDRLRSYWRGEPRAVGHFASRLSGSSDIFARTNRSPQASINFICCHDGFTLRDLVTYSNKRNLDNGEENRDGRDDNRSWNCGVEGESKAKNILSLRLRQQKNFLASLFLSAGTPMLLAGDEMMRTQKGNNNAYCQDNELSWVSWKLSPEATELLEYVKALSALRRANPALRRASFFTGNRDNLTGDKDLSWWTSEGVEMEQEHWAQPEHKAIAVLWGRVSEQSGLGYTQQRALLLICNPSDTAQKFTLPLPSVTTGSTGVWGCVFDTGKPGDTAKSSRSSKGQRASWRLLAHSMAFFNWEESNA